MGASDAPLLPVPPSTFRHYGAHSMLRSPRLAHAYNPEGHSVAAEIEMLPAATGRLFPTSFRSHHQLNTKLDRDPDFLDSSGAPSGFLQQDFSWRKVQEQGKFLPNESGPYPIRDPFDTSPEQVCEKLMWFLLLMLPILTAVLVSVCFIGCPACCGCEGDPQLGSNAKHPNKDKGGSISGGASRPQTEPGEGEQQQDEDGGEDVDSQVAELEKLFAENAAAPGAAASAPKSMLEQHYQPNGSPTSGKKPRESETDENRGDSTQTNTAGTEVVRGASFNERSRQGQSHRKKAPASSADVILRHDEEGERNWRCRKLPRRGGGQCCWMNCAVWTLAVLIMALIEWLCVMYAVSDQHWDQVNPRTKVVIITSMGGSGGDGYLNAAHRLHRLMTRKVLALDQSKCADKAGDCCADPRDEHEPQACRDGYLAIADTSRRRAGIWRTQGAGCYGCYAPANNYTEQSGRGAGGVRDTEVIKQSGREDAHVLKQPKGWIPYAGAAPIRLEKDQVEMIYSIPPRCTTSAKTKKVRVTRLCRRRSWLNLPLISLRIVELLYGRVIADVGVVFRDAWDAAQKKGDQKKMRSLLAHQELAESLFAHNAQAAMAQYLERHPNVEWVVSTQPLFTGPIFDAVVATNERTAKDIRTVLHVTSPPSKFNLFLPGLLQWQAQVELPGKRRHHHYYLDAPRPGRDVNATSALFAFVGNHWWNFNDVGLQQDHHYGLEFQKKLRKLLETDGGYYRGLGLGDLALEKMRMTSGVLPRKFEESWERTIRTDFSQALGIQRRQPLVLRSVRNVYNATTGEKRPRAVDIRIRQSEHVIAIMTGAPNSHAADATLQYLRTFAQRGYKYSKTKSLTGRKGFFTASAFNKVTDLCQITTIFVFCWKHEHLCRKATDEANRIKRLPGPGPAKYREDLRVYVLGGWQNTDTQAEIMERANIIIVRASGLWAFRAVAAGVGATVITHSDGPLRAETVNTSSTSPGMISRVCTEGMLPHQMGTVAWLAETLPSTTVVLCDLRVCEGFLPNKKTGRLLVEDDPKTGASCLSERDPTYRLDYGSKKETESLGC